MYTNPYGQAGWDPSRASGGNPSGGCSSIYGALPYSSLPAFEDLVTFHFVEFSPNVLNCSVVRGGSSNGIVQIDSKSKPGYTLFKNRMNHDTLATIRWRDFPTVDIPGVASKLAAGRWLELSSDNSCRKMSVSQNQLEQYMWVPQRNTVNLINSSRDRLAKIERQADIIVLHLTKSALQAQLLEPCIVATVLFMSGNNID